jgi:hypothetical protein
MHEEPNIVSTWKMFIQICDFGLSRSKAKTYISSTNAAGRVSATLESLSCYMHFLIVCYMKEAWIGLQT